MFNNVFSENHDVYGAREATGDNRVRCMRFACWLNKATHARAHANASANPHART